MRATQNKRFARVYWLPATVQDTSNGCTAQPGGHLPKASHSRIRNCGLAAAQPAAMTQLAEAVGADEPLAGTVTTRSRAARWSV